MIPSTDLSCPGAFTDTLTPKQVEMRHQSAGKGLPEATVNAIGNHRKQIGKTITGEHLKRGKFELVP
jgi:hypothetical protein